MVSAALYEPNTITPPLFTENFEGCSEGNPTERTAGYYIEKIKTLLRQDKFDVALKVLETCNEKFTDLPDWQFGDLKELETRTLNHLDSILSEEELKKQRGKFWKPGFQPIELAPNKDQATSVPAYQLAA